MNFVLKEVPENMEELKRKATNQSNWRERLEAVNEPIRLDRKPKGNLVKGINGKLVTVRNSLPEGYTLDEFKKAFQERYPVAYDIYDGNKGERLDKWLENVTKSLPKTK